VWGQVLPSLTGKSLLNSVGVDKHCWCWELALANYEAAITLVAKGFSPVVTAHGTGVCAVRVPA